MVTLGNRIAVLTQSGDVFGHDVSGRDIGPAFKFTGSKAAFSGPIDRFVLTIGNGFTGNSGVKVAHQFQTVGSNGVGHQTQGESTISADQNGHFDGVSFSLSGGNFNIQARAVDVATGRNVDSAVPRPQV